MKQAKVKLTYEQLDKLSTGGVLTIRLRDTELLLSAETALGSFMGEFFDILKGMRKS